MNVPLFDKNGRSFYIKCLIETESAGLCLTFYAQRCLLSMTDLPLEFFYEDMEHSFA